MRNLINRGVKFAWSLRLDLLVGATVIGLGILPLALTPHTPSASFLRLSLSDSFWREISFDGFGIHCERYCNVAAMANEVDIPAISVSTAIFTIGSVCFGLWLARGMATEIPERVDSQPVAQRGTWAAMRRVWQSIWGIHGELFVGIAAVGLGLLPIVWAPHPSQGSFLQLEVNHPVWLGNSLDAFGVSVRVLSPPFEDIACIVKMSATVVSVAIFTIAAAALGFYLTRLGRVRLRGFAVR